MNDYKLVKNTEWKHVEINGENKEIPKNWKKVSVSELVLSKGDLKKGPFGSSITKNMFVNNGIKVYEQKNAIKKDFNLGNSYITKEKFKELSGFIVEPGDFIMSCAGTIGELYLLPPEAPTGVINQALIKMKICKEIIHYSYFKFLFSFDNFKKGFSSDGGIIVNFNLDTLRKVECILPILEKQSAIADILSSQESIIQDIESLISKYESRFQYLSEELLSGRLRVKELDGQLILYKNAEDNWKEVEINGEMKQIPMDWNISKVSDIFEVQRGKVLSKDYIQVNRGIYPVYSSATENNGSIGNINSYMFDGEYLTWTTDGVYAGTVFYRKGKFNCTNICGVLKDKTQNSLKGLFYFIKSELPKHVNHIGNSKLMSNTVSDILFIYPETKEQFRVAKLLTQQEDLINQQKEFLTKEKQKFDWLLDNLLSGKYLVQDQ